MARSATPAIIKTTDSSSVILIPILAATAPEVFAAKTPARITRKNVPYTLGDMLNGGDSILKGKALNIEIIAPMKQNTSRYTTSNRGFER
ncbi:Uncharacterised protein [Mycobacteroides abscessus]|nr:Uncharacterised protein [Mycobacteroides abscessus]